MSRRLAVFDLETPYFESYKRAANVFDPRAMIVAAGAKYSDGTYLLTHVKRDKELLPKGWLDGVEVIVGHNLKFDILYTWENPDFIAFLKRGGRIFCTQYAEYLLTGQHKRFEGGEGKTLGLNAVSESYGGEQKLDIVKTEYWEKGIDTIDVPVDILLEYLQQDLDVTEFVSGKQTAICIKQQQAATIQAHMDSLLATSEMEWNGLCRDEEIAERNQAKLESQIAEARAELDSFIPKNLPEEITWTWTPRQQSAIFFGGRLPYKRNMPQLSEAGEQLYAQKKMPYVVCEDDSTVEHSLYEAMEYSGSPAVLIKSGAKKGQYKTKQVNADDLERPRFKFEEFNQRVEGQTAAHPDWKTKNFATNGQYKTDEKVKLQLAAKGVGVAKIVHKLTKLSKLLAFYKYEKKGKMVGMLTLVQDDGLIHHMLNHYATVTGRLSSSNPNMQQCPRPDTGDIRQMFVSRWGAEGRCIEADYSQLEVHGQAYLTGDRQMIEDVTNKVDFHCKRLSAKLGEDYYSVLEKAKDEKHPDHGKYKNLRTGAKIFSFQRAYGASIYTIAAETGMSVDDVQALSDAEDNLYPGIKNYNNLNQVEVERSGIASDIAVTKFFPEQNFARKYDVGFLISPTGKRYSFVECDTPDYIRKRSGKVKSFLPTQVKNYPVQGFCGELMMNVMGVLWREFLARDNFGGKALLINTVHDCFWVDCHESVSQEVAELVRDVMEDASGILEKRYEIKVDVPFYVDVEIGLDFYDMHGVDFAEQSDCEFGNYLQVA